MSKIVILKDLDTRKVIESVVTYTEDELIKAATSLKEKKETLIKEGKHVEVFEMQRV